MIASGEAEQAVGVCREVTETLLEHLLASPAAWREYVGDWELQRKHAVSEAALDLDSGAPERKVRACTQPHCAVSVLVGLVLRSWGNPG